jgi:cell division protein DivIC
MRRFSTDKIPFLRSVPSFLLNKYLIVIVIYLGYMFLFDSNNYIRQWERRKELSALEEQHAHYSQQLEAVKKEREQLFSDTASMETFARENYYMKRDSETVYIFVEE